MVVDLVDAVSLHRNNPKRDANEPPIIEAFKRHGCGVTQNSQRGYPDLTVSRFGRWHLVEVKREKGKLTEDQAKFMSQHDAWVWIMRSVDDVELFIRSTGE